MKPLAGRRIIITRPRHQASELRYALEDLGAEVLVVPVVEIVPPANPSDLENALKNVENYDWVVLTSANGVEAVRAAMSKLGMANSQLSHLKLAAIGPATASALTEAFRAPDLVPAQYLSESIADEIPDVEGQRFLLARANLARKDLADALRAKGANVDEVEAYRIVRAVEANLPDVTPDAITLTSAEIVRATVDLLLKKGRGDWLAKSHLICIGPVTAAALRELGYEPSATATQFDSEGLTAAVLSLLGRDEIHA